MAVEMKLQGFSMQMATVKKTKQMNAEGEDDTVQCLELAHEN
jgi:hypothetical protein